MSRLQERPIRGRWSTARPPDAGVSTLAGAGHTARTSAPAMRNRHDLFWIAEELDPGGAVLYDVLIDATDDEGHADARARAEAFTPHGRWRITVHRIEGIIAGDPLGPDGVSDRPARSSPPSPRRLGEALTMIQMTKGLRAGLAHLEELAQKDPTVAQLVRDRLKPDLEHHTAQLEHEAAVARIAAGGKYCEEALELLCGTVEELPEVLGRLRRKFERELGRRAPRRKALWVSGRESTRTPTPCSKVVG